MSPVAKRTPWNEGEVGGRKTGAGFQRSTPAFVLILLLVLRFVGIFYR